MYLIQQNHPKSIPPRILIKQPYLKLPCGRGSSVINTEKSPKVPTSVGNNCSDHDIMKTYRQQNQEKRFPSWCHLVAIACRTVKKQKVGEVVIDGQLLYPPLPPLIHHPLPTLFQLRPMTMRLMKHWRDCGSTFGAVVLFTDCPDIADTPCNRQQAVGSGEKRCFKGVYSLKKRCVMLNCSMNKIMLKWR